MASTEAVITRQRSNPSLLPLALTVLALLPGCASAFPLHEAAREGKAATVERILNQGGDVNSRTPVGYTPLMMAVLNDQAEVVKLLLARGADVNPRTAVKRKMTFIVPLRFFVTKDGRLIRAVFLDENLPNVKETNQELIELGKGYSALSIAALLGNADIVQALLGAGALVDDKSEMGMTPLLLASGEGHIAVVKTLLSAGADINHRDEFGRTPLLAAIQKGKRESLTQGVRRLRANPITPPDEQAKARLAETTANAYIELVTLLLAAKADPNLRVIQGYDMPGEARSRYGEPGRGGFLKGDTAVSIAKRKGHPDIVQMLEQAGATRD
jgi:ankyrin repeat protein